MTTSSAAAQWQHSHNFDEGNPLAERNTRIALLITAAMMVIEIAGGWVYNSMALLADGWHMSSHALALGLSALAYAAARRLSGHQKFAFGTWKIEVLAGFASALALLAIAAVMAIQSAERLVSPTQIYYREAIVLAVIGLLVNLVCAWLLRGAHHHGHSSDHADRHAHGQHVHHQDLNLRSAYLHVLADAATSVLAIVALAAGLVWGARWLDPAMGLLGALLVGIWSWRLLRDTAVILLDAEMDAPVVEEIRDVIRTLPVHAQIQDLHVWRVGKAKYACIVSLACQDRLDPDQVRRLLDVHEELAHITVEINPPMDIQT